MRARLITIVAIIFTLALMRLLPHAPNVSPVAAMALFAGAYFTDRRMAFMVPFAAMFFSDLIIGLHSSMVFVYSGFALTVLVGMWLREKITITSVTVAAVGASILFFLITNFGAWVTSGLYAITMQGLMQAYIAGIPFFQNSLLGNLVFTAVIFGGFVLLQKNISALRVVNT